MCCGHTEKLVTGVLFPLLLGLCQVPLPHHLRSKPWPRNCLWSINRSQMDVSLLGGNTERLDMIYHLPFSCLDNMHRDGASGRPGNSQKETPPLLWTAWLCSYKRHRLEPHPPCRRWLGHEAGILIKRRIALLQNLQRAPSPFLPWGGEQKESHLGNRKHPLLAPAWAGALILDFIRDLRNGEKVSLGIYKTLNLRDLVTAVWMDWEPAPCTDEMWEGKCYFAVWRPQRRQGLCASLRRTDGQSLWIIPASLRLL